MASNSMVCGEHYHGTSVLREWNLVLVDFFFGFGLDSRTTNVMNRNSTLVLFNPMSITVIDDFKHASVQIYDRRSCILQGRVPMFSLERS